MSLSLVPCVFLWEVWCNSLSLYTQCVVFLSSRSFPLSVLYSSLTRMSLNLFVCVIFLLLRIVVRPAWSSAFMCFIFLENYLHISCSFTVPGTPLTQKFAWLMVSYFSWDLIPFFFSLCFNSGERTWLMQPTFSSRYFCSGFGGRRGRGAHFRTDQLRSRPRVVRQGGAAGTTSRAWGKGISDGERPRPGRHPGWPAPVQHKAGRSGKSKSFSGRGKSR